jgi:hypothetical protein
MDFQKLVGALELKQDSTGKVIGIEYVSENDPRVARALEQVRQAPEGSAQKIENAGPELQNVAVVAVQG